MTSYATAAADRKNLTPLTASPNEWPLERVLRVKRDGNHRYKHGRHARRASSYEHQIDRIEDLPLLGPLQGQEIKLETGHGVRRKLHTVDVFQLVYAPRVVASRALRVYQEKIRARIDWLRMNGPRETHWARHQSRRRARRNPEATRYSLKRREWPNFWAWRAVYDEVVRMLLTVDAWWNHFVPLPREQKPERAPSGASWLSALSPSPRSVSSRPTAETTPSETRREREPGERCRAQSVDELWQRLRNRIRHGAT